jgi:hemerythrin-like domain-containing protein
MPLMAISRMVQILPKQVKRNFSEKIQMQKLEAMFQKIDSFANFHFFIIFDRKL